MPNTPTNDHPNLIDALVGSINRWGHAVTRAYRIGDTTIRVRIVHHAIPRAADSTAVAEVLTPHHTWTDVASSPMALWWPRTPPRGGDTAVFGAYLVSLADSLFNRAAAILNLTPDRPPDSKPVHASDASDLPESEPYELDDAERQDYRRARAAVAAELGVSPHNRLVVGAFLAGWHAAVESVTNQ